MGECCQDERQPIAEQGARAAVNITPCRPLQEDFRPLMHLHRANPPTNTDGLYPTDHARCIHHRVRSQAFSLRTLKQSYTHTLESTVEQLGNRFSAQGTPSAVPAAESPPVLSA